MGRKTTSSPDVANNAVKMPLFVDIFVDIFIVCYKLKQQKVM